MGKIIKEVRPFLPQPIRRIGWGILAYLMKKILSILLAIVLTLSIVGCSASAPKDPNLDYNGNYGSSTDSIVGGNGILGEAAPDKNNPEYGSDTDGEDTTGEYLERKIVYTVTTEIQTKAFNDAMAIINNSIEKYDGYIQTQKQTDNGNINSLYSRRNVYMVVRIPSKNLDAFLSELKNDCMYTLSLSKDSKDYSTTYYDKEVRVNSLRVQEERLLDMLSKATDLKTLLELEDRLSNIRYQIESLTKEMNIIDSNVNYSTVTINMSEVVEYVAEPVTFGDRLKTALSESWENLIDGVQGFILWFIYAIPTIAILGAISVGITLFTKMKIRKKKAKRAAAEKKETE